MKIDILQSLELVGQAMVLDTQKKIVEKGKRASGNLLRSIDYSVKPDGEGGYRFSLVINPPADKYAQYVELGRKPGKQPPLTAIQNWCKYKGINIKYAFPIARSIGQRGIQPTPIFSLIYKEYLPIISKTTEEELALVIEKFIADKLG